MAKSDYVLNGEPGGNYFWAMMVTFMQINVYAISCLKIDQTLERFGRGEGGSNEMGPNLKLLFYIRFPIDCLNN